MTDVSLKDTKQALWDAYRELLEKYRNLEAQKVGFFPEKAPRALPKSADFFGALEDLKKTFLADVDAYRQKTREKFDIIDTLAQEIEELEKRLQDGHNVANEVESLYALLELQRKKTQEFEDEIAAKKRL